MGGPIHLFQVRSAFTEEYTNHYFEPWLSYTEDTQDIDYNKPEGRITVLPEPTANLAYDGTSKNLIIAGSGTGTMMYKLGDGEWSTSIPQATTAGTYTVYYKTAESDYYHESEVYSMSVTLEKATPTVVVPTPIALVYNGSAQTLANAGSTDYGTIQYSLNNSTWSTSIPTATNSGTYSLYYRVVGNANVNDVPSTSINCSIAEKVIYTPTIELSQSTYSYDGSACEPSVTVKDGSTIISPSEYVVSYSNNTNAGTATVIISDTHDAGNYYVTGTTTFTINKASGNVTTAPTAKSGLVYDGSAQNLVNAGSGTGTMMYKVGNGGWSSNVPVETNAGDYTVYYKAAESTNYTESTSGSVNVSIAKANPTYTAPTAKTGLTYNGNAQALLNAGSTNHGTIQYSSDNSTWSATIPNGTNATSYTVYWKLVGDSNHNNVASTSVSASIAKANPTYTAPTAKTGLTYNGSSQTLLNAGSTSDGTLQYSSNNSTWGTSIPSGTNATSYTSYWRIIGDSNHNDKASASISTSIAKAAGSVTTAPTAKTGITYNGSAQALVNAGSGTGTILYSLNNSTWSSTIPSGTNATSYTVYYKASASTNYNESATGSTSVTIARAERTMSWASQPDKVVCGETVTATATRTGDGAISYSSNNTSIAIINSNSGLITGVNTGTCTITASVPQTTNYNAKSISYTLTVGGYEIEYLTFEITSPGNIIWKSDVWGETPSDRVIQYKKNNGSWTNITATTAGTQISVVSGDTVQFRGDNASYQNDSCIAFFSGCTCGFKLKGNIMSMINSTGFVNETAFVELYPFTAFFQYCTGLTDASNLVLPATGLTESCYQALFYHCTNLTAAPSILPATTLASYCYESMFSDCWGLTVAPILPATSLAQYCYNNMFYGCTSLTTAPTLPAMTLAESCYQNMFGNCSNLTKAPELPATTLSESCYNSMFQRCRSLTSAPELPATVLANSCYTQMFYYCTSLTAAPSILPATTLTSYCYYQMFRNCSSLNYIKCLATTNVNYNNSTYNWVQGVATSGTFIKADGFTGWPIGNNGIPTNWVAVDQCASEPLTFEITSAGNIRWLASGSSRVTIQYKKNDGNWASITSNTGNSAPSISVVAGDTVQFRGDNVTYSTAANYYNTFSGTTCGFKVKGNIMSLVNSTGFTTETILGNTYAFNSLFDSCSGMTDASKLVLPATTVSDYCYYNLFNGCTNLISAPSMLPATTLGNYCYWYMFSHCYSLVDVPELPATELTQSCYASMFYSCTTLNTAPSLPATTLATGCYGNMFMGCRNLTIAPKLPAETLVERCYQAMFYGCTNLTVAPELIADTLATNCYRNMFSGCSSLNYIKCLATTNVTTANTQNWVQGVATSGTFIKADGFTGWTVGVNGIPTNWVSVDESAEFLSVPLTFEVTSPGTIRWKAAITSFTRTIQYKKNNGSWTNLTSATGASAPSISVVAGDVVQFRGDNVTYCSGDSRYNHFSGTTCGFNIKGNIMSLINSTGFSTAVTLSQSASTFFYLFSYCTGLTDASNLLLPATTLMRDSYYSMFGNCSSLTKAPKRLPATTLGYRCYGFMFDKCTNLVKVQDTIGTTSTTMSTSACTYMFRGCTSLTTAPELPATALNAGCYMAMFSACTSLVTGPSSIGTSATSMPTSACANMFRACTSLTTAPELPARTLASFCYSFMFYSCGALVTGPSVLPAAVLTQCCYDYMFYGCTSLTTAPEIGATSLASYCCRAMFQVCRKLQRAPVLSATSLTGGCYQSMFGNCSALNYVKCLATTNINATNTGSWLGDVSSTGTFVKPASVTTWPSGMNGIPTGWTVENA